MPGGAPLGNANNKKGTLFRNQLTKIIKQEETTLGEKQRRLYKAANKLLGEAAKGEEWAIKELANRLDGKAVQGVELSGEGGVPINIFDAGAVRNMDPQKLSLLRDLLQEAAKNT